MIFCDEKKESIYRDFYPKVNSYIHSHIKNKSEVEDLVSSVFIKVYSSIEKYDEKKASLSTWIYAITKNTVINYIRKQKFNFLSFETIVDYDCNDEPFETDHILEKLDEELSKLPKLWQDIVILHYYFGFSHKEICEKVNLSYASTRKQCSFAIAELKKQLL